MRVDLVSMVANDELGSVIGEPLSYDIAISSEVEWEWFEIPTVGVSEPIFTVDIRLGLISKPTDVEVLVDDLSLTDELEWLPCDPETTDEAIRAALPMRIARDGWLEIANTPVMPTAVFDSPSGKVSPCEQLRRFYLLGPHYNAEPLLPCEDLGEGEVVEAIDGRGFDAVVIRPDNKRVYHTKRSLLVALKSAQCTGMRGIPYVPLYPFHGQQNQKFPLMAQQIQEWAAFFELHPALGGWVVSDEMSTGDVHSKADSHPVRKWIHDAERAEPPVRWHPVIANINGDVSRGPAAWDLEDACLLLHGFEEPPDPSTSRIDNLRLLHCINDQVHIGDILAPNTYPLHTCDQNLIDYPRFDVATVTAGVRTAIRYCEGDPSNCWPGLPEGDVWEPKMVAPYIQIFPWNLKDRKMPNAEDVLSMAGQAVALGAKAVFFWRTGDADGHELPQSGRPYDLLDPAARADWDAEQTCPAQQGQEPIEGLWQALPEINEALHEMADLARTDRPLGTRHMLFGPDDGDEIRAGVTDTYVQQRSGWATHGTDTLLAVGQRNYTDGKLPHIATNRALIRIEPSALPDVQSTDLERAYLRLLVQKQYFRDDDAGGEPYQENFNAPGPLRVGAYRIPERPEAFDWDESAPPYGDPPALPELDWIQWMGRTENNNLYAPGFIPLRPASRRLRGADARGPGIGDGVQSTPVDRAGHHRSDA